MVRRVHRPDVRLRQGHILLIDIFVEVAHGLFFGNGALAVLPPGPQAHFWGGTWLLAAAGSDNPTMLADVMNTFINGESPAPAGDLPR